MKWFVALVVCLHAALRPPAASAQDATATRTIVNIPRVASAPKLEDYVNAPAGQQNGDSIAAHITGFRQRDPGDLTPVSEQTDAFVSYDDEHLYVVFVCRAKDPAQIRARMSRRESVFADDLVGVFLDTFNDRQRAYMFFSTPLGIQADRITTEGQGDDMSFDAVWRSSGRVTSFGYVVWMSIPFKSLRFPPGSGPHSWGFSLMRGIPKDNEQAFWPGISRKVSGFAAQFGEAHGLEGVSPGRNVQLVPYGTFTGARFLGADRFETETKGRAGADVKVILRDAIALDLTANPDFSQVESDEPQVTINQRFEVFFPEKRPFFLENAGYFVTPVNLFFSRRVRDPQLGARATGKLGGWAAGALVIDDRAQGDRLPATDPLHGDHALNAVVRARREFGESSAGALVTTRQFGPGSNNVAAVDTRLRLNPRWFFSGQAVISDTKPLTGSSVSDSAYAASVSRSGRKFSYNLDYQDIGSDFQTQLGFVPRTDIRQATSFAQLRWRPAKSKILSWGPNSFVQTTWDRKGELQDWTVRYPLQISFRGQTGMFVRRQESMERFEGTEFREHENLVLFFSSFFRWMDVSLFASSGTRPNFFPAEGLSPFLANFRDVSASLTFRPASGLLIDQTYLYSRLQSRSDSPRPGTIFDNHILRSRVNYQFTREFSLRAIFDYNGVLANSSLVALDRTKHLTADVLFTYLLSPGTAVYVGYTDGYDNVALNAAGARYFTSRPTTSTGRQIFVKTSYLFRF